MKKNLLLGAFLISSLFTAKAQQVLLEDSFEDYENFIIQNIGEWTQIDVDQSETYGIQLGTPPLVESVEFANSGYVGTGIIFNPSATNPALGENWNPRTGSKSLNFFAAIDAPNDDWFITPQIMLGDDGNSISFWAKSITDQWGLERIRVAISTSGNTNPTDFTVISSGTHIGVPVEWTEYTFNLDDYAGQNVYIAINYISDDSFALLVDDFVVATGGELNTKNHLASQFSVYPNPTRDVINISNSDNILINNIKIMDINGRTVKSLQLNDVTDAQVNISDLSGGVYLMNVSSDRGSMTKKIVKN